MNFEQILKTLVDRRSFLDRTIAGEKEDVNAAYEQIGRSMEVVNHARREQEEIDSVIALLKAEAPS